MVSKKFKKLATNALLILVSLAISLAMIEASLRLFYPKYQYAAESSFDRNAARIWSRKANTNYIRKHPDSKQPHAIYHNNLALRQHRDFTEQDIESAKNLAFFGDSYTENLRIPAQYSLTEPLDFLLNKQSPRFNVLNLGVDAYGTDQSYIYYRNFEYSDNLDYVFYIFCLNDLRNIYENNLFTLDESKKIVQINATATPWWIKIQSKFHTTYLVYDIKKKLQSQDMVFDKSIEQNYIEHYIKKGRKKRFHDQRADAIEPDFLKGEKNEDIDRVITIFQSLLRQWSDDVKSHGGKFFVVLLPREKEHNARSLIAKDINVIDLYELFDNGMDNYDYNDWRFKEDTHWNEAGNMLAATYLYKFMENELDVPITSENTLKQWLYTYYSSFDGWMPDERFLKKTILTIDEKLDTRSKYLDIELKNTGN